MSEPLRNRLWNSFTIHCLPRFESMDIPSPNNIKLREKFWDQIFYDLVDEMPIEYHEYRERLKDYFLNDCSWYQAYEFLEF